jgi:hypothetical protein
MVGLIQIKCGSELARDEAIAAAVDGDCQTAIASKLAPTWTQVFFSCQSVSIRECLRVSFMVT